MKILFCCDKSTPMNNARILYNTAVLNAKKEEIYYFPNVLGKTFSYFLTYAQDKEYDMLIYHHINQNECDVTLLYPRMPSISEVINLKDLDKELKRILAV